MKKIFFQGTHKMQTKWEKLSFNPEHTSPPQTKFSRNGRVYEK